MRSRNIKPGFFKNENLAELDPLARILFAGLWCMADREGRLEYRPKRIKVEVLPYDNTNIEKLIVSLAKRFIIIYEAKGEKYIQIKHFKKHQNCHIKEAESIIPAPCETDTSMEVAHLIPDSLLLIPECGKGAKKTHPPTPRVQYLDSVLLTDDEHKKLTDAMGKSTLLIGLEKLDYSITVKGQTYKDHYKTLLNWFKRGYFNDGGQSNGRGKGNSNGGFGNKPEPTIIPEYTGEDIPTEEERERGLQKLRELTRGIG